MRLPDSIGVRCLAGREAFPGTWVVLALESVEKDTKTAFSFSFGPVRDDGRLLLYREDVLAQSRYLEEIVGLDYGRLEDRWDGRGWLSIAGADELRHQFRLTFGKAPLRQATSHRAAAARALRLLSEYELERERLSVAVETELPKKVAFAATAPPRGDWLPESLHEPVRELLVRLARRELRELVETGALVTKTAKQIEKEIIEYGATPIDPPDIALLLATAAPDGEQGWTVEVPLWTREEGPSDLAVWIHAREAETGLELELRGVALA
ncbi:MAG: hypothetical protein ABSC51_08530 [Gaiellaceae bacterium]|jgi:hypothetical protein